MQIERFSRREDKTERMMSLRLLDKDTFPIPQHKAAAAAVVSAVPDPPPHAVREPTMAAANANAIHFLFFIKYVLLESYCVFADSHSLPIIQL